MRRFFVPDKEKCEAFLRAQKNVLEQNRTKGASPTAVLRKPSPRRGRSAYKPVICRFAVFLFHKIIIKYMQKYYNEHHNRLNKNDIMNTRTM
jgi:hypothetical protein